MYPVGTIVEILSGEYKGYEGVIKKFIGFANYLIVNPIVDGEVKDISVVLHVNEIFKEVE